MKVGWGWGVRGKKESGVGGGIWRRREEVRAGGGGGVVEVGGGAENLFVRLSLSCLAGP